MRRLADALFIVAGTLWAGSLWTSGYVVAPMLFLKLAERGLAGRLAGEMFTLVAWIGIACASYLLAYVLARRRARALRSGLWWIVLAMLTLTLVGQFGVQPVIAALKAEAFPREVFETVLRDRFATWHGVASVLHLLQSGLAVAMVVLLNRGLR